MAATMIENGLEVPSTPLSAGAGLKPYNVPSLSSKAVQSSHKRTLNIPNFDDPRYDDWILSRIVAGRMANYESRIGKVQKPFWRKALTTVLETVVRDELSTRKAGCFNSWRTYEKKSVSFFVDVPYKHSAEGEIFEGPVTSQLTFEKELGEDVLVFVNPESSD